MGGAFSRQNPRLSRTVSACATCQGVCEHFPGGDLRSRASRQKVPQFEFRFASCTWHGSYTEF